MGLQKKKQIKPKIEGYQNKIANKYETERKIKKNDKFEKEMDIKPWPEIKLIYW